LKNDDEKTFSWRWRKNATGSQLRMIYELEFRQAVQQGPMSFDRGEGIPMSRSKPKSRMGWQ